MALRAEDITLVHRVVGTKHVITSLDVPELHVSHADEATARASVPSAIAMIESMKKRLEAKRELAARRSLEAA